MTKTSNSENDRELLFCALFLTANDFDILPFQHTATHSLLCQSTRISTIHKGKPDWNKLALIYRIVYALLIPRAAANTVLLLSNIHVVG